jgi:EAL domain-containing protein (putative c-di-GMP-specific phosphodiesterase class I)
LGHVSPEEFIPIAEAAGVISDIDFHVMGIFARQLGRWRAEGLYSPASINLSPNSFEDSTLAPRLLDLLESEGVAAETVTVEITETSLISMSEAALANINQLRQAGINLSIDDFGTGYSSFSYLQKLIVSEIKIDKSFIHLLTTRGNDDNSDKHHETRMIVRSILALARTLGIRALAEGVENAEQLAWLQQEGCHSIQGYLSGRAVGADTFERTYLRPST